MERPPTSEDVVMYFRQQYFLDEKDSRLLVRLMDSQKGATIPSDELARWKKIGVLKDSGEIDFAPAFEINGVITPAFWLKCLLIYHGLFYKSEPK